MSKQEKLLEILFHMPNVQEEIELQRTLVGERKIRYAFDFAQYYHQWLNGVMLECLAPRPGNSVLDCGCGTGILLPSLETCYQKIVGLDLSLDHLLEARTFIRRSSLVVGDIAELPVAPQSFDHVICRGALYRVPDVRRALSGLFDILKEGGGLLLMEPIGDSRIVRFLKIVIKRRTKTHHKSVEWKYTSQAWMQMAEAAGFRTVRWFNLGYVALPLLGYPEASRIMRYLPLRMPLARLLLHFDRFLADIPWMKTQSWHAVFHFKKPFATGSTCYDKPAVTGGAGNGPGLLL